MGDFAVLPAVDLKGGKCVRLRQGRADDATVYGEDPVAQAREWARQGAAWLHVVDLDAAFAGGFVNCGAVRTILPPSRRGVRRLEPAGGIERENPPLSPPRGVAPPAEQVPGVGEGGAAGSAAPRLEAPRGGAISSHTLRNGTLKTPGNRF